MSACSVCDQSTYYYSGAGGYPVAGFNLQQLLAIQISFGLYHQ